MFTSQITIPNNGLTDDARLKLHARLTKADGVLRDKFSDLVEEPFSAEWRIAPQIGAVEKSPVTLELLYRPTATNRVLPPIELDRLDSPDSVLAWLQKPSREFLKAVSADNQKRIRELLRELDDDFAAARPLASSN